MYAYECFITERKCKIMICALENELVCYRKMLGERPMLPLTHFMQDVQEIIDELNLRLKTIKRISDIEGVK